MDIRLDQKRALVTGGSSGIREAIALGLADAGAKVAINYHSHILFRRALQPFDMQVL